MLNLRPKAARDDEPDLTPLIDMVFILLIFFILAASFAVPGHRPRPASGAQRAGAFRARGGNPAAQGRLVPVRGHTRGPRRHPREAAKPRAGLPGAPRTACAQGRADAPVEALVFIVDEVRMQGGEKLLIATAQPDEAGRP